MDSARIIYRGRNRGYNNSFYTSRAHKREKKNHRLRRRRSRRRKATRYNVSCNVIYDRVIMSVINSRGRFTAVVIRDPFKVEQHDETPKPARRRGDLVQSALQSSKNYDFWIHHNENVERRKGTRAAVVEGKYRLPG